MVGRKAKAKAPPHSSTASKRSKRANVQGSLGDGQSREERFISKLAALLQGQGPAEAAALRTESAVHEALSQSVDALPDGKPLKAKLQADLLVYGQLLAKLLGIAQPGGAPTSTASEAATLAKSAHGGSSGRCSLFLDSNYLRQLSALPSVDQQNLHSLLMARVPVPAALVRECLSRQGGSAHRAVEHLQAAVALCSALTPLSAPPGADEGWITCVAELGSDALSEVVRGQASIGSLAAALSCFFAGRAARMQRLRHACDAENAPANLGLAINRTPAAMTSLRKSATCAAGELLLMQAYAQAMQAGILGADGSLTDTDCTSSASHFSVVSAVVHGIGPLGCAAWQGAADLLLKPELQWPCGSLPRPSDDAMWQIFFHGLEASHSVPPLSALWDGSGAAGIDAELIQMYLTRVLLHKRALARARNSGAPRSGKQQAKLPASMLALPPPPALCEWLRSQPLNQTVAAALAVVDRQAQDLTSHFLLRTQDKEITALLKLWKASWAAELAGPSADDVVATAEPSATPPEETGDAQDEDTLFFVDTEGEALTHFGRSWERGAEEEDSEDSQSDADEEASDSDGDEGEQNEEVGEGDDSEDEDSA